MSVSGHCFQWSSSFMGLQPATERSNIAVDVAWGTCRIWFTLRRASRHWKGRIDRLDVGMWENMQGFRKGRKYLKLSLNNYTGLQVPDWNWFLNFNIECVSTSRFFPLYRLIYSRWTASDVYDVSKLAQGLRSIGLVFASLAGYLEVNETVRPKIIKAFQSKSDADVGRSSMRYSFLLGNAHFCLVPKGPLVADNLKTESSWRIFLKNGWAGTTVKLRSWMVDGTTFWSHSCWMYTSPTECLSSKWFRDGTSERRVRRVSMKIDG